MGFSLHLITYLMNQCYREEHQRHSPQCPFLQIADPYKLTVREVLQLELHAMECIKVSPQLYCIISMIRILF